MPTPNPDLSPSALRVVPPVALSSDRVMLRPYRVEDVSAVFAAVTESVGTVGRWLPWCHAHYTEAESIAWIEKCQAMWQNGESYEFGMFDLANEYVGGAGLHQLDRFHNMAALGYWVRQSRQNCGLATAAVRALVRFGFGTVGLTRIEIVAASENDASRRVAEKAGAQFECIARNRLVIRGVPVAAAVHSFVPRIGR